MTVEENLAKDIRETKKTSEISLDGIMNSLIKIDKIEEE
jgi:hypothetical protein